VHACQERAGGAVQNVQKRTRREQFDDGYCSTVQGLLDWFEVDLGFTELSYESNQMFRYESSQLFSKSIVSLICIRVLSRT